MGLLAYPTPSDAGILCMLLMNAATFISIVNGAVLFILQYLGMPISNYQEDSIGSLSSHEPSIRSSSKFSYIEEFQKMTSATRYNNIDSVDKPSNPGQGCSVCLRKFEPDSLIYLLSCGHVFHTTCLETWLKYWNVTCPLCRTRIIPLQDEEYRDPMLGV